MRLATMTTTTLKTLIVFVILLSVTSTFAALNDGAFVDAAAADFHYPLSSPDDDRVTNVSSSPSPLLLTSVAFGSCHNLKYVQQKRILPVNLWEQIYNLSHPQMFLWLGDSVYPHSKGVVPVDDLAASYDAMKVSSDYHTFQRRVPVLLGAYDDHDYGGNDYGRHMPDKSQRAQLFWHFLGHQSPPKRKGVYYSVTYGNSPHPHQQVKIIVLDTRYFRDDHCMFGSFVATKLPVLGAGLAAALRWLVAGTAGIEWCDAGRTMLGATQWAWLEQELSDSHAALHIVVSSVQVLTTNPAMESWGQFPSEQRRLLALLKPKAPGLILLSGDVHHAEILRTASNRSIVEVTSSGLTHDCTSPRLYGFLCDPLLRSFPHNRQAPDAYYTGRNFGHLTIDWNASLFRVDVFSLSSDDKDENNSTSKSNHNTSPVLTTGNISFAGRRRRRSESNSDNNDFEDDRRLFTMTEDIRKDLHPCMDGHLRPIFASILVIVIGCVIVARRHVSSSSSSL